MKKIILFVVIIVITMTMTMPVYGVEVPKLNKEEATKIIGYMGYTDVVVGFVIHGVGRAGNYGGDSVAIVTALGKKNGEENLIEKHFFYDYDIGWFYFEVSEKELRLWTKSGYRKIHHKVK